MISRREKLKAKHTNHASLSSVENSQITRIKTFIEVKDRWVKVRVTRPSGTAGAVMLEGMLPPKKFVAVNGEQIRDLGEKERIKAPPQKRRAVERTESAGTQDYVSRQQGLEEIDAEERWRS